MLKLVLALSVAAGALGLAAAPQVAGGTEPQRVTFLRDVAPILNKVGCTAGTSSPKSVVSDPHHVRRIAGLWSGRQRPQACGSWHGL